MQIGFIGVGKITSVIVEGLCTSSMEDIQIFLSPRNEYNGQQLADKFGQVQRLASNQQVVDQSEVVFIAVKPMTALEVLRSLSFRSGQTIVSLVPLLKMEDLLTAVAPATEITRAVPTPTVIQRTGPILIFQPNEKVSYLFSFLGQPVYISEEPQLHVLWTLTGLITPYYELLQELSRWTIDHGVDPLTAKQYIAGMFQALSFAAQQDSSTDFRELAQHAETPNGMNEQAGKEIREKGAHLAYRIAADNLLKRFE